MEIELKHLAGYLPYDTVVFINDCKHKNIKPIHKLHTEQGIGGVNHLLTSNRYRIVLHPLSDLTKEIEVNGEKFIPIYKLFEIEYKDTHHVDLIREMYFKVNYTFTCSSHYGTAMETSINTKNIMMNNYWKIQKLLEWHFDIYGLIEKGLAIDINTLNK